MKIISWNMAHKHESWRCLLNMDVDLALLQEACKPPPDVAERIEVDTAPWETRVVGGRAKFRTAVVKLSNRIEAEWIETKSIDTAGSGDLVVSSPGTLAAAFVTPPSGEPVIAVSMYAQWVKTYIRAGSSPFIVSDGSAHRIVSDLSAFIADEAGHRVLAAGDLNILRGYGEYGDDYWAARYKTVFDRMEVMGFAPAWGRNTRTAGRPPPGLANCHGTAGTSPPINRSSNRRKRRRASWTTSSPRGYSRALCRCVR